MRRWRYEVIQTWNCVPGVPPCLVHSQNLSELTVHSYGGQNPYRTAVCARLGMKTDSVLNAYHKRQRAAERERGAQHSLLQSNHISSSQFLLRQNSSCFWANTVWFINSVTGPKARLCCSSRLSKSERQAGGKLMTLFQYISHFEEIPDRVKYCISSNNWKNKGKMINELIITARWSDPWLPCSAK